MTDLTKLQAAMQSGDHKAIAEAMDMGIDGTTREWIIKVAQLESNNAQLMSKIKYLRGALPRWIDCEVELPKTDETVLVYCFTEFDPIYAAFYNQKEWLTINLTPIPYPISHWMPLPQKPEIEDKE